ncbi:D-alanyl-D-alanine carboxypeptidase family protein [Cryobacterium sp. SO2]|uniref:M15 family metallopeptidase n=1 Tax=Cryobacterium sp. SO2 TaxID=1897060 RepID=UPI00223D1DBA|nr:D-alanyl-D-alanine carboxypeptidase family protein [Cryobacterium sp. SO2]WEO77655.1 D-alanyl-D-alanine carboxypeptidase family protein [Cryobacterium sp. SO2]
MSEESRRGASPRVRRRRALAAGVGLVIVAVITVVAVSALTGPNSTVATAGHSPASTSASTAPTEPPRPSPTASPEPAPAPTFDRAAHSIDDPNSIWVVVDKLRPLNPTDYAPADLVDVPVPFANPPKLRQEASDAVVALFAAFTAETGLALQSQSAYRSFEAQTRVYDGDVANLGQAGADLSTARPGTSEHQTGLTIDISAQPPQCSLDACFGDTPHGQWLAANAWRFGFLLRYPADKVGITGYEFEPWHFRYIGIDLATEMHNTNVSTLEEFFGLPAAPSYG